MEMSAEQKQAMEAQKANCPFCKIVKGEIPSKKVYEDDLLLVVLDINPASKGHVLVMPKEHYPIMPLIPPETFEHLFAKTKHLSKALKEGVLVFGDTIFIANGFAAGQQSSHFMLHIIPREDNDGLEFFTLKKKSVDAGQLDEAYRMLKNNLPIMLRNRYPKYPLPGKPAVGMPSPSPAANPAAPQTGVPPQGVPQGYTKESLIALIESNPQLKEMVTNFPDAFKLQVTQNDRLKQLFAAIDLDEIIAHFGKKEEPKRSMDELVQIINDNPKLKEMLLKQTYQFAQKVKEIPQLNELFGDVDIEELERAVLRKEVKNEQDVKDLLGAYGKNAPVSSPLQFTGQQNSQEDAQKTSQEGTQESSSSDEPGPQQAVQNEVEEDQDQQEEESNEGHNEDQQHLDEQHQEDENKQESHDENKDKERKDGEQSNKTLDTVSDLVSQLHSELIQP